MTRRWALLGLLVVALAALAGWQLRARGVGSATGRIARQIQLNIRSRAMPADAPWRDRRTRALVRAFYAKRHMQPAWTDGAGPLHQARDLADVLTHADAEGLNPEDYSAAELAAHRERNQADLLSTGDPKALAEFDLLCTIAAFHYMSDVFDGRISPKALDAEWVAEPHRGDLDSQLGQALREDRVKEMLVALAPTQEGYRALREARARMAAVVAAGGWSELPSGPPLARGQRGRRVQALRARLIASGDLPRAAGTSGAFDSAVESAVRASQRSFGHEPDGVVRVADRADLNVPALVRLRQIELNMERWRWLPRAFGDRYLIVNVPEYALHVVEGGRPVLDMRVVVGKVLTATPMFSDSMTQVVVNPTWSVPRSIAAGEFAPAMQRDPGYLANAHIRIFDGETADAKEVDPASVNWSDTTQIARLHFQQDAGDDNALGHIKFLFPNQFDVYLHGTPAGHLFSREDRSFSHGCVRLEDPLALAHYVLSGAPEGAPGAVEQLIASGTTTTLQLPHPLPVHIVYFTAFVDAEGALNHRDDIYGIDQNLLEALRGRSEARARQMSPR